jgi:beta-N-acetylhexosaminidase
MVLAVALAVSACHPGVTPQARPTGGGGPGTSATPTPAPGIPSPSSSTSCAERVLARMTEDQRVGQLFLLGLKDDVLGSETVAAIRAHHFGSVWFVKTSSGGLRPIRAVAEAVQSLAGRATTGRALFFVAANQEGGIIQALRGPGFSAMPSAVDQGALDPSVLQEDAHRWGLEMAAAGVNMNFAPVMDVVPPGTDSQNQPIGVLKREYEHDPASAGTHGVAFLRGMAQAGIATVAKHFPGMGRVEGNTDNTADVLDGVTTSDDPYLGSFRRSIRAGVPFVMVALATYTRIDPDDLAVFSPAVMVGMLRDELHFGGGHVRRFRGDKGRGQHRAGGSGHRLPGGRRGHGHLEDAGPRGGHGRGRGEPGRLRSDLQGPRRRRRAQGPSGQGGLRSPPLLLTAGPARRQLPLLVRSLPSLLWP